jgi:serine/threonine protein kinase
MLTGRRAFPGATLTYTLVAIIEREPDWSALPPATPPAVRRLLRRCLEKDPNRRLHDIADARIEIEEPVDVAMASATADAAGQRWTPRRVSIATSLTFAAACGIALGVYFYDRPPAVAPPTRLSVFTPGQITPQLSATIASFSSPVQSRRRSTPVRARASATHTTGWPRPPAGGRRTASARWGRPVSARCTPASGLC